MISFETGKLKTNIETLNLNRLAVKELIALCILGEVSCGKVAEVIGITKSEVNEIVETIENVVLKFQ